MPKPRAPTATVRVFVEIGESKFEPCVLSVEYSFLDPATSVSESRSGVAITRVGGRSERAQESTCGVSGDDESEKCGSREREPFWGRLRSTRERVRGVHERVSESESART